MAREVTDPRIEPTGIFLLNGHSIKLTLNDESLYPQIDASLKLHQRLFCLPQMVINTKPTSDQRIETQPADCPVLNVTPMPQPFLDSSGITVEESEVVDDYQETLFSRHNRVAIHMTHINCDSIHKPNTTSTRPNPSTEIIGGYPTLGAMCCPWLLTMAESVFFRSIVIC